jgi:hypothetical protein
MLDTQNVYATTVTVLCITTDIILTTGPSTVILPVLETKYEGHSKSNSPYLTIIYL